MICQCFHHHEAGECINEFTITGRCGVDVALSSLKKSCPRENKESAQTSTNTRITEIAASMDAAVAVVKNSCEPMNLSHISGWARQLRECV
jgi:hypothetical protein